ncbi:MAG: hypothetical protein IJK66_05115 [Bacilli bacterium]|nr:hypothetical protein [Bacilli bacterium]
MLETWSEESLNSVFSNSIKALTKFVNPNSKYENMTKVLCLGKVQSGKTAFFISSIALAFDNGYDIAYVIGGTKNNLLTQNKDRIRSEFYNNDDILIMDINNADSAKIKQQINNGCKVILMVLKHKSATSEQNLANLEKLTSSLNDVASLIVDDEGDEYSPGAKNRQLTISQSILTCVSYIKRGTYLSVTATPQSNLLLSTRLNNLSPDSCVLVEPGVGYTGASVFHDTCKNPLVKAISDTDDFELGIPKSFSEALKYYLIGAAVRALRNDDSQHSMLVHPSSKTKIQSTVYDRVKSELHNITTILSDAKSFGYDDLLYEFEKVYIDMKENIRFYYPNFNDVIEQIKKNLNRTDVFQINTTEESNKDIDEGIDKYYKYKILVGGNMLERGITVKNLAVTYIYRSAKQNPIDSTLQRARWFGYKESYLDLCRVYMTNEMKEYFVAINTHEEFLWKTVEEFLKTNKPMQCMKRIFVLNDEKLILTRKSVSKTIRVGSISQGYSYSKSINYENKKDYQKNYSIINQYLLDLDNNDCEKKEYLYGGNKGKHKHKCYINISLKEFYEKVVSKLIFPRDSSINDFVFRIIIDAIDNNFIEDKFVLVKMRDGENEFRSTIANGMAIKELPESYQVSNDYPGDKAIYNDELNVQIHNVYTEENDKGDIIPILTINYPYDKIWTNYVTGEFE